MRNRIPDCFRAKLRWREGFMLDALCTSNWYRVPINFYDYVWLILVYRIDSIILRSIFSPSGDYVDATLGCRKSTFQGNVSEIPEGMNRTVEENYPAIMMQTTLFIGWNILQCCQDRRVMGYTEWYSKGTNTLKGFYRYKKII